MQGSRAAEAAAPEQLEPEVLGDGGLQIRKIGFAEARELRSDLVVVVGDVPPMGDSQGSEAAQINANDSTNQCQPQLNGSRAKLLPKLHKRRMLIVGQQLSIGKQERRIAKGG